MNLDEILLDNEEVSKLIEHICLDKTLVRRILETDHLGSRLLKRMEAAEESLQQLEQFAQGELGYDLEKYRAGLAEFLMNRIAHMLTEKDES